MGNLSYLDQVALRRQFGAALERALRQARVFATLNTEEAVQPGDDWEGFALSQLAAEESNSGQIPPAHPETADIVIRTRALPLAVSDLPANEVDAGVAVATFLLWNAGRVPSWFVRDNVFDPILTAAVEVSESGFENPALLLNPGQTSLNFAERAAVWAYFAQILVPPFFLPASAETARPRLIERSLDKLVFAVASYFKTRFPRAQVDSGRPFLLLPPSGDHGVLFFVPGEVAGVSVDEKVPPGLESAEKMPEFLRSRTLAGATRTEAFEKLASYLAEIDPAAEPPTVEELGRKYLQVLYIPQLGSTASAARVLLTYSQTGSDEKLRKTWTLPAQPGAR